ncbi:hypothetical protein QFZ98_005153 [Paraburkholderia youngii]
MVARDFSAIGEDACRAATENSSFMLIGKRQFHFSEVAFALDRTIHVGATKVMRIR